jgi:hypothetical protein
MHGFGRAAVHMVAWPAAPAGGASKLSGGAGCAPNPKEDRMSVLIPALVAVPMALLVVDLVRGRPEDAGERRPAPKPDLG